MKDPNDANEELAGPAVEIPVSEACKKLAELGLWAPKPDGKTP